MFSVHLLRRADPPKETIISRIAFLLAVLLVPLAPGEGAATTLKDLTASVTLRSSVPCSGARAGLPAILPGPDSGVMCAIGIGGGTGGIFERRCGRRKLTPPTPERVCDHNETDNDLPFEESLGKKDFVSDAPFDGPATNAPIGLGGGPSRLFGNRASRRGLRAEDDGEAVATAIDRGLRWLSFHQGKDGRWEGRRAITGLALLAYLGVGQTHRHGNFKRTVKRGLRHIKQFQTAHGYFADRSKHGWRTEHAILTLAMTEAFGLTGSPLFKGPAQRGVNVLARTKPLNAATAAWFTLVFRTAEAAGLTPPEAWKETSFADLKSGTAGFLPTTTATTAAAVAFARVLAGEVPSEGPQFLAWANGCAAPDWSSDPVLAHFAGLALFQAGGSRWTAWSQPLMKTVTDAQVRKSGLDTGSWSPTGPDLHLLGRVGTTALACLTLETRIRYVRINRSR